jgi:hypothetical protein
MAVTWQREWIHAYESPWSIFEKFKSINKINTHQLLLNFGSAELQSMKNGKPKKIYRDLNTLYGFQITLIAKVLNYDIKKHINTCYSKLNRISPLNVRPDELFHSNLVFCENCLDFGYHSFLHQFRLIHKCPFHSSELQTACPHCFSSLPYELPDHTFEHGFICGCGNSLVPSMDLNQTLSKWSSELPTIKDEQIARLATISDLNTKRISNTYVLKPTLYSNNKAISHLLEIADNTVFSNAFTNKKRITQRTDHYQDYKRMYVALQQVLNSFERYLKKSILVDHVHCIFRFTNLIKKKNEPFGLICPYAYAFVFWKEAFLDLSPFSYKFKHERPSNFTEFKVPYQAFAEDVEVFTSNLFAGNQMHQIDVEWTISHLTWQLAKQYFRMWINIAEQYAEKGTRPNTKKNANSGLTELLAITINNEDNTIGFLALPREGVLKHGKELNCPYATKYFKKIRSDEISFLPLKLAINAGFEREIVETEKYLAKLRIKTFT